jgi:hypothetical protein
MLFESDWTTRLNSTRWIFVRSVKNFIFVSTREIPRLVLTIVNVITRDYSARWVSRFDRQMLQWTGTRTRCQCTRTMNVESNAWQQPDSENQHTASPKWVSTRSVLVLVRLAIYFIRFGQYETEHSSIGKMHSIENLLLLAMASHSILNPTIILGKYQLLWCE